MSLGHKMNILVCAVVMLFGFLPTTLADVVKARIAVVSSYHKEYLWSQDTNEGVVAAFVDLGYLDDHEQGRVYSATDYVESSTAVLAKFWMDTKRKNSEDEMKKAVSLIVRELERFKPDLILLGDDNATNYIGNQYIDTEIPIVFWGVNGNPLKYDLVDSVDAPGHNVTGIYQAGYLKEGVQWLQKLLPHIKKLAVLSDSSPTGRSKAKELERFVRQGELSIEIVDTVVTNSAETWKTRALDLADDVDAFFVLNHNTLKGEDGRSVDQLELGAWYLRNIKKPDLGHEKQFVVEGVLCAIDDSGFKQGYEAVTLAHQILAHGKDPGTLPVYAPERGNFVVNLERAEMLGLLDLVTASPLVEEQVEKSLALEKHPESYSLK